MTCSGIYQICNRLNRKVYIGSSKDIEKRWKSHERDLKNGRHPNKELQKDYLESPNPNFFFCFTILEICDDDLLEKEFEYCKQYNAFDPEEGYNKSRPVREITKNIEIVKKTFELNEKTAIRLKIASAITGEPEKKIVEKALNEYLNDKRIPDYSTIATIVSNFT